MQNVKGHYYLKGLICPMIILGVNSTPTLYNPYNGLTMTRVGFFFIGTQNTNCLDLGDKQIFYVCIKCFFSFNSQGQGNINIGIETS